MAEFQRACRFEEIVDGRAVAVELDGLRVAVHGRASHEETGASATQTDGDPRATPIIQAPRGRGASLLRLSQQSDDLGLAVEHRSA